MTGSPGAAGETIPLTDLRRIWPEIRGEAAEALERLGAKGDFSLGHELARFEEEFAGYCGARHCVGLSDGTQALHLALVAVGAGPGTSVITTANTFVATVEAIAMAGARPLLIDADPLTRCMAPGTVAEALQADTVAVIPVHLHGYPAPVAEIEAACPEPVAIIEDAAQAHGATLGGRRVGSLGRAGAFSFYPTKNLGALGDGGAVVCDDPELAATVRSLRHHGAAPGRPNLHERRGGTARLDNLQAAFLRIKLPRLDEWNAQRRAAAARYRERLAGLPLELPPPDPEEGLQVHHVFAVLVEDRDRVLDELRAAGIAAGVHYPTPVHLQPAWSSLGYGPGDLPVAERLAATSLSLPLFPGITEQEIERVAERLARALS